MSRLIARFSTGTKQSCLFVKQNQARQDDKKPQAHSLMAGLSRVAQDAAQVFRRL
jgi:hypothetical protein